MATDRTSEPARTGIGAAGGWGATAMPRNPELAKQVARDAQRVVAGELSEEEFYEKYHEAYLREFGFDNRPIKRREGAETRASEGDGETPAKGADEAPGGQPPRPMTNKPMSRRAFLMLAAGGAIAMVLTRALGRFVPGSAAEDGGSSETDGAGEQSGQGRRVQMGMVIDLERCTGCLACVDACHRENNLGPEQHWIYVLAYQEKGQDLMNVQDRGHHPMNFLVLPCQHCSDPPCVKVCPTLARHKREKDGLVLTDYDVCIGSRYCQVACPYGVNYFQWGEPQPQPERMRAHGEDYRGRWVSHNPPRGVMGKCTFCPQRQDSEARRGTTACQQACPHEAIFFGDMNDPDSAPRRYLEKKRQEKGGRLSTFRLLEEAGTEPNIIYIGHQPSKHAKQVEGPTTYEEWGWVDEGRTVQEGQRPWFMRVFGG